MRSILFGSSKSKNHGHTYLDEDNWRISSFKTNSKTRFVLKDNVNLKKEKKRNPLLLYINQYKTTSYHFQSAAV